MGIYLKQMKEWGYSREVDTSLGLSGADGWCSEELKVIALGPNTPWHVFRHEFQHARYNVFHDRISREEAEAHIRRGGRLRDLNPSVRKIMPRYQLDAYEEYTLARM